jgi:hypothetical protein
MILLMVLVADEMEIQEVGVGHVFEEIEYELNAG